MTVVIKKSLTEFSKDEPIHSLKNYYLSVFLFSIFLF